MARSSKKAVTFHLKATWSVSDTTTLEEIEQMKTASRNALKAVEEGGGKVVTKHLDIPRGRFSV